MFSYIDLNQADITKNDKKNHHDENEKASRWFLKNITMIFKGHHGAGKNKESQQIPPEICHDSCRYS